MAVDLKELLSLNNYPFKVLSDDSLLFSISINDLISVAQIAYNEGFVHLSTIIGYEKSDGTFSLNYPLFRYVTYESFETTISSDIQANSIVLSIDINNPSIEISSIEPIFLNASIYEREIVDILGLTFQDKNYLKNDFLFNSNYPTDFNPLRKKFTAFDLKKKLDELNITNKKPIELSENKFDYSFSIGPQHPTHKEPVRFQFFVEGEQIRDVAFRIGFNHRGIEKAIEMNSWIQNLYLIERICGICSGAHQIAYVTTAEKIARITLDIPERALYLRVLIAELERIHSHILWYGVLAHDAGFDLMFQLTWKDREIVMDILEKLSGNRVNYSFQTIGGVRRDINKEFIPDCIIHLKDLRKRVQEHSRILEKEKTFTQRLVNVGYLSHSDAITFNAVGPSARSSGLKFDLRKNDPYAAYKDIPFKLIIEKDGDIYANMLVRLQETLESIDMCIYVLENIPIGDIAIKAKARLHEGESSTRVEAPRGEDYHYIRSIGGTNPDRYKIRAPTLANIPSLIERFKGMQIADIPMIIRSIDPCIGCMERVTFVNLKNKKEIVLGGKELISKAQRTYRLNEKMNLF